MNYLMGIYIIHIIFLIVGMILGAFFYGFFFTQVPTGYLCMKYGGKNVLMFSMASASFIHILIPTIVRFNDSLFFAARVLQGLLLVSVNARLHLNSYFAVWVRGIVVLNVECEFRDRSSNPIECHDHVMLTLGKSTLP